MREVPNPAPVVGEGATVHYVTDSSPYVVTYVSPSGKSVRIAPVSYEDEPYETDGAYLPVLKFRGILNHIVGDEKALRQRKNGGFRDGTCHVSFGQSVRRIDYSF